MCIVITEGRNGGGVVVKMCRGAVRHMILMKEDKQRNKRRKKTTPRNFPSPVSLSPIRCLHALSSAKDIVWNGNSKVNNSTQQY